MVEFLEPLLVLDHFLLPAVFRVIGHNHVIFDFLIDPLLDPEDALLVLDFRGLFHIVLLFLLLLLLRLAQQFSNPIYLHFLGISFLDAEKLQLGRRPQAVDFGLGVEVFV